MLNILFIFFAFVSNSVDQIKSGGYEGEEFQGGAQRDFSTGEEGAQHQSDYRIDHPDVTRVGFLIPSGAPKLGIEN